MVTDLHSLVTHKAIPYWRGEEDVRGDKLDDYVDLGGIEDGE